jgi:hypothetical protein
VQRTVPRHIPEWYRAVGPGPPLRPATGEVPCSFSQPVTRAAGARMGRQGPAPCQAASAHHQRRETGRIMARKPNYGLQRSEVNRAKQAKNEAKQREREEAVARRKAAREGRETVGEAAEGAPGDGEPRPKD